MNQAVNRSGPPRKICVVVTARASYSRIRSALEAIRQHEELELQLVVAASAVLGRYGNALEFIHRDGFDIAAKIYNIVEGENLVAAAKSTGLGLVELATVLNELKPDAVVTIADRFETMATAIATAYMNIPLVHVQGGEVTGSIDEKVRHAITKLADIHLVSCEKASERVIGMGEHPQRVFVTGCPSIDLAASILSSPTLDYDPIERFGGVGAGVNTSSDYLVVLQHPVTTEYDQSRGQVTETLHAISELGIPTIWFWPNVDAGSDGTSNGIRTFREKNSNVPIHFFKHMDSLDFLRLAYNSRCVIGNSSVAIRECSFLGIPAVNIGSRQQGRDRGANVVDVEHDRRAIIDAVGLQLQRPRPVPDELYGDGDAGRRIANVLATATLTIEKRLHQPSDSGDEIKLHPSPASPGERRAA